MKEKKDPKESFFEDKAEMEKCLLSVMEFFACKHGVSVEFSATVDVDLIAAYEQGKLTGPEQIIVSKRKIKTSID